MTDAPRTIAAKALQERGNTTYLELLTSLGEWNDRETLHEIYYHLLHLAGNGEIDFDLVEAYQRYCGKTFNAPVAPAMREPSEPKARKARKPAAREPKVRSVRKQIIAQIKEELQCKKFPGIRNIDEVPLERFTQHLQYWLLTHNDSAKAANAWYKEDQNRPGDLDYIKQHISESIFNLIK